MKCTMEVCDLHTSQNECMAETDPQQCEMFKRYDAIMPKAWVAGYLCAVHHAGLYLNAYQAMCMLRESGFGKEVWVEAQKRSSYRTPEMMAIIEKAFA